MLAGKVVMITGVGSGLGRALSQAFAANGCTVVGIARREETLRETEALVASAHFFGHIADVANFTEVEGVVAHCLANHARVDILFNNAAIYPKINFLDEPPDMWRRTIDVNVNGVANCCKAVLPAMIEAGSGRIYNVGSFADLTPIPDSAAYSASKGAVRALTKAIAQDLQHLEADIEVHEWIPGHLNTQMSGYTGIDPGEAALWAVDLASMSHARTRNCIFVNDKEWLPPKGLRRRIKEKLMFWRKFY
jgi:NAD(P)-dependent dehydrogenase (short-subunit alcohol dehydrogenase family)